MNKNNNNMASWRLRRDITVGTILHLFGLGVMLVAVWCNLQKELALIHHELNRLVQCTVGLQEHVENVSEVCREYEFRLRTLEHRLGNDRTSNKEIDCGKAKNGNLGDGGNVSDNAIDGVRQPAVCTKREGKAKCLFASSHSTSYSYAGQPGGHIGIVTDTRSPGLKAKPGNCSTLWPAKASATDRHR